MFKYVWSQTYVMLAQTAQWFSVGGSVQSVDSNYRLVNEHNSQIRRRASFIVHNRSFDVQLGII